MYRGLPRWVAQMLRCSIDGGELTITGGTDFILDGSIQCLKCGHSLPIADGILDLLEPTTLHRNSQLELKEREQQWADEGVPTTLTDLDRAELEPHLEALSLRPGHSVAEFGCGSGRYTREIHRSCARLVAIDFSREALLALTAFAGDNVALVRADVGRLRLAPGAFDRMLSTLTSNLPTPELRQSLFRTAAEGLAREGRFVFGSHYYGARARVTGVQKSGYYEGTSIYRFYTTRAEAGAEVNPWFERVRLQPVQILIPFSRRLHLPLKPLSRACERIPLARECGQLLMGVAEQPRTALAVAAVNTLDSSSSGTKSAHA